MIIWVLLLGCCRVGVIKGCDRHSNPDSRWDLTNKAGHSYPGDYEELLRGYVCESLHGRDTDESVGCLSVDFLGFARCCRGEEGK